MSILNVIKQTFGLSGTASENHHWDGSVANILKLKKGTPASPGVDVITVNSTGQVTFPQNTMSMIRLASPGSGSIAATTNTAIRYFTDIVQSQGTDISLGANPITLGATFTINVAGVYAVSYFDMFNLPYHFGLSLNSTHLTTAFVAIPIANILCGSTTANAGYGSCVSWTGYLPAGSVVRPHSHPSAGTSGGIATITIARVA